MNWYDYVLWTGWMLGLLLILAYSFVLFFGAPYLPTMKKQREEALDLLGLTAGQTLVDLGSGDGRLLALAAERGFRAVGYEINPFLFVYSWLRTRRYGWRVKIRLQSFWQADLSQADGVFVFLIAHHMGRLDKLLSARNSKQALKVVSHAFPIPGKQPFKRSGSLFLYIY
ncbi:class I SAM-dependent methyltransferase [Candidatus Saccharibacteria bacterium]|nr:class I SAM-dependent methyltransferase [Candidatus Saccharibacteria bacterium]